MNKDKKYSRIQTNSAIEYTTDLFEDKLNSTNDPEAVYNKNDGLIWITGNKK